MIKKKNDSGPKGANWMDTYGDMVTLLLTFFVLLYSFSSVDSNKWERLVAALSGNKSVLLNDTEVKELEFPDLDIQKDTEDSNTDTTQSQEPDKNGEISTKNAAELYQQLKSYIEQNNLSNNVAITKNGDEIRIRFTSNVLFDLGKADIRPDAYNILNDVASALKNYNQTIEMVRIEGHTDNLPISTREFPSNWELSTSRAVNVLRYFVEVNGLPATRLSAVGYGEYHPFADNSTEAGRAMNRRVDFVINVIE